MKSQAMRGAMYAAAAGKSNIGIPKKVGAEFVAADKPGNLPPRAPAKSEEKGEKRRDSERRESNHYPPLGSMSRRSGY